jgi:cytidylate kinase
MTQASSHPKGAPKRTLIHRPLLITIDGPAGAGKTTISRMLAAHLDYDYIDTGALYRGVALAAVDAGVAGDDDVALEKLCNHLELRFQRRGDELRLVSNGIDVNDRLRTPELTMLASAISARPVVRNFLLSVQRQLGAAKRAVFEGRDMGTVVFPDADVKFFLDADLEVRARRRFNELQAADRLPFAEVKHQMQRRDQNDSTRSLAPLKPAPDAIRVNSTALDRNAVVEQMLTAVTAVAGPHK